MMKDNHVAGEGNAYYTLFREYDPDLGRWWRPDPIFQPWQSPYSAFDGNPIMFTDVWGLEAEETEIPPEPEHSFVMPEWRAEADRPIYKNESERAYALFLYQNEEFRLALLGYGLIYQFQSKPENNRNNDGTQASRVPNVHTDNKTTCENITQFINSKVADVNSIINKHQPDAFSLNVGANAFKGKGIAGSINFNFTMPKDIFAKAYYFGSNFVANDIMNNFVSITFTKEIGYGQTISPLSIGITGYYFIGLNGRELDYKDFETNWMNGDKAFHGNYLWFDGTFSNPANGNDSYGIGFSTGIIKFPFPKSLGSISIYNTQTLFIRGK